MWAKSVVGYIIQMGILTVPEGWGERVGAVCRKGFEEPRTLYALKSQYGLSVYDVFATFSYLSL